MKWEIIMGGIAILVLTFFFPGCLIIYTITDNTTWLIVMALGLLIFGITLGGFLPSERD